MQEVDLRKGVLGDLPTLYEFEQGIVEAERPFDHTLKPGRIHYYDLKAMLESSDTEVIVAVFRSEIIGTAYLKIKKSQAFVKHTHFGYLGFMYVKPEHRGKGLSKQIIEEIKKRAAAKEVTELRLDVYCENNSAMKAYEKAGFKQHLVKMRLEI